MVKYGNSNKAPQYRSIGEDQILTTRMVANYLQCHLSTVYRFVKDGRIPYFKLGGDLRFQKSGIEEWIQKGAMWSLACLQQRSGEDRWPVTQTRILQGPLCPSRRL